MMPSSQYQYQYIAGALLVILPLLLPITKANSLGVYNTRTKSCPNLSIEATGYTTLLDLQLDLTDYFHSLTFPPTTSPAPSESPTSIPSISPTSIPSLEPTYAPTNIPTKAPITARPTPPPTSAIRVPQDPTKSPSPTIEVVVVNPGGGGGTSGPPPTQPDRRLRAPVVVGGATSNNSPTIAATRVLGDGITAIKRSRDPITSVAEEVVVLPNKNEEGEDDGSGIVDDLQLYDAIIAADDADDRSGAGGDLEQEVGHYSAYNKKAATENTNKAEEAEGYYYNINSRSHVSNHQLSDGEPITFPICPNSNFDFTNYTHLDTHGYAPSPTPPPTGEADFLLDQVLWTSTLIPDWSLDPVTIETPLRNPIEITCLSSQEEEGEDDDTTNNSNCTFTGGAIHILINNAAWYENYDTTPFFDDLTQNHATLHNVTISKITFTSASMYSTLLQDPRSAISYVDCTWRNHTGVDSVLYVNGTFTQPEIVTTTTTSSLDNSFLMSSTTTASERRGRGLGSTWDENGGIWRGDGWSWSSNSEDENGMDDASGSSRDEEKDGLSSWNGSEDEDIHVLKTSTNEDDRENSNKKLFTGTGATAFSWGMDVWEQHVVQRQAFNEMNEIEERLLSDYDKEENEDTTSELDYDESNSQAERETMRLLSDGVDHDEPRSAVFIEGCSFIGNTGNSTIKVSSNEQSNDHSIHLKLLDTDFTEQDNDQSVIENTGGSLHSSGCLFIDNRAVSMIESRGGAAVKLDRTEFSYNDVTGGGGVVVLDSGSELEDSMDNCVQDHSERRKKRVVKKLRRVLQDDDTCDGIEKNGECQEFDGSCDAARDRTPTDKPSMMPSKSIVPSESPSSVPSSSVLPTTSGKPSPIGGLTPEPTPSPITPVPTPSPMEIRTGTSSTVNPWRPNYTDGRCPGGRRPGTSDRYRLRARRCKKDEPDDSGDSGDGLSNKKKKKQKKKEKKKQQQQTRQPIERPDRQPNQKPNRQPNQQPNPRPRGEPVSLSRPGINLDNSRNGKSRKLRKRLSDEV